LPVLGFQNVFVIVFQYGSVPPNSRLLDITVNASDRSEYIYYADIVANYVEKQLINAKQILNKFQETAP
jgi:hypothetical protein